MYTNKLLLPCGRSWLYSDVIECLPVDPATWVRFPAGTGKIFSLYDMFNNKLGLIKQHMLDPTFPTYNLHDITYYIPDVT